MKHKTNRTDQERTRINHSQPKLSKNLSVLHWETAGKPP